MQQAEQVGDALRDPRPDVVYVSDLVRAQQTAAPLCAALGLDPIVSPDLRERDMGVFVGVGFEEVQTRWPEGWAALARRDPDYAPPEGESHRTCAARVAHFLDGVRARHVKGRVVLVSHGVAIHHMLCHLLGDRGRNVIYATDNACVHRLALRDDGSVRVLALNDSRHLTAR
jgi:probable phosphoglycerate mutase